MSSASFPDHEVKEKVQNKSQFGKLDQIQNQISDSNGPTQKKNDPAIQAIKANSHDIEKVKSHQFNVEESIKEVDESENLEDQSKSIIAQEQSALIVDEKKKLGTTEQEKKNYIHGLVNKIWSKYDIDNSGVLDKIEAANFLNEILMAQELGPPTMEQFNRFFSEFDINNDGVIQRSEMARFIKRFIYGEQNHNDSSSLI